MLPMSISAPLVRLIGDGPRNHTMNNGNGIMTRRRIFTLAAVSGGEVLAVALVAYLLAAR
jgi:hypothetical protein